MTTKQPQIAAAEATLKAAQKALAEARRSVIDDARRAWIMEGGCTGCDGTGHYCSWSTLDGHGYNEWSHCAGFKVGDVVAYAYDIQPIDPAKAVSVEFAETRNVEKAAQVQALFETFGDDIAFDEKGQLVIVNARPCTATTVGPRPGKVFHYSSSDCNRPRPLLPVPELPMPTELEEAVENAKTTLESTRQTWALVHGARVRVVRGRKVPQGTEGECCGVYDGDYGTRIGIQLASGERVFTAASNCEVIEPSATAALPSLYGSEKQVAWALTIRKNALAVDGVSEAEAQNGSAKWWIDNRSRWLKAA